MSDLQVRSTQARIDNTERLGQRAADRKDVPSSSLSSRQRRSRAMSSSGRGLGG